jgi:hypothetical protein
MEMNNEVNSVNSWTTKEGENTQAMFGRNL